MKFGAARNLKNINTGRPEVRTWRRTTVGELIAVAFDVVGGGSKEVQRLLDSPQMRRALKSRVQLA